jgi:peroxiredoxin
MALACLPLLVLMSPAPARAQLAIAQVVPDFTLNSVDGRQVSLSGFRGKHVVVEWTNPGCPFVRKHYESSNMPALQKRYGAQNVVWLLVSSTHPGHADWLPPDKLDTTMKAWGANVTATLLDEDGRIGRAWGARTTPQMYIIDPQGRLVYSGAIDDRRSARIEDIAIARNWVVAAFDDIAAGRPVAQASTVPYGCSVKY